MPANSLETSVELLVKAQRGDDDAIDRLLARHLPRLRRWASRRLPSTLRTMIDTGDLVQEAAINALPHLAKIEVRSDHAFQFYLQQAVRNRIIDLAKRRDRRPRRVELSMGIAGAGTSPLDALLKVEGLQRYERALARLRPKQRNAVVRRLELQQEYAQIATELGMRSPDAARMMVTRAIVRLADAMEHRGAS
jgi:RNA polymerase sigma-70 factor (ECF subfamily)